MARLQQLSRLRKHFFFQIEAERNLHVADFCLQGSCLVNFHLHSPQIKQTQDEEKKQLTALRDLIKSSLQLDQKEVGRSHPGTP